MQDYLFTSADFDPLEAIYNKLATVRYSFEAIMVRDELVKAINAAIVGKMTPPDDSEAYVPCHKDDARFHDQRGS